MATTIRLRRSTSNKSSIRLKKGEPFYNTTSHKLYIGNTEDELLEDKKALNELTSLTSEDNQVNFQIGDGDNSTYTKTINNVDNLANFTNTSEGSTVSFTWGTDTQNPHKFEHTVSAGELSGEIENAINARKVTNSVVINDTTYKFNDIFSDTVTDGIPNIKYAQQATNAYSTNSGKELDVLAEEVANILNGTTSVPKADITSNIPDIQNLDTAANNVIKFQIGTKTFEKQISVTVPGSVEGANKLTTARAIDGVLFDGTAHIHHLFKCDSDANVATKVISPYISSGEPTDVIYDEEVGAHVFVWFTKGNTATTTGTTYLKLQVNGKQAHNIRYKGQGLSFAPFITDGIYEFIFTGSDYDLITPIDYYSTEDTYSKSEIYNKTEVDSKIPSLKGYATETYVKNAIAEAELNDKEVDLSGYATKDELKEVQNQIPSIEGLATTEYVDETCANARLEWQTF